MDSDDQEYSMEEPVKQKRFVVFDYYEDARDFPEFSIEEIDVFIEAFEEFDVDGSGSIDAHELKAAFASMGQGGSDEVIQELIEEFDADKSGEIDWKEYLMMMRNFYPWKRQQYIENYLVPAEDYPEFSVPEITIFADAFREADVDQSGTIDVEELRDVFNMMGQGCSEEEAAEILEEFDDDKSGFIEFGEFLEIMRTCFYPMKRIIYELEFYGPALKHPEFSRKEIDTFARSFKKFDKDGSGSIDIDELGAMFKQMGQGATQDDIKLIIEVFDKDASGEIEWDEYLDIMATFYPWKKFDYVMEYYLPATKFPEFSRREIDIFSLTFREFDLDESGSIDARELGIALKKMGQGASPEKIKKIIADVDDNGNGEIEWPEYLKIMQGFYPEKRKEFETKYLEPAKAFPEFDEDDIMIFLDSFRDYDLDGSGSIDARELELAFKQMGQGASKEKIAQIIADVDDNGNGEIDWVEFLTLMRNMYSGRSESTDKAAPTKTAAPSKSTTTTAPSKTTTTAAPVKPATTTTAPAKTTSTTTTPAKTTSSTTTASPVKPTTTAATTTPSKTVTATPTKSTTPASTTPAKTTTTTSSTTPAKSTTTSTTTPPAKSGFGTTKPSTGASSTTSTFASHRASNNCPVCSKTVYPVEAISANDMTYHKNCFRCQEPGCNLMLSLTTFKGAGGKVYCKNHVPAQKATQLTVQGSLATSNAVNAPKVSKTQGIKKNERMTFAPGELKPITGDEPADE